MLQFWWVLASTNMTEEQACMEPFWKNSRNRWASSKPAFSQSTAHSDSTNYSSGMQNLPFQTRGCLLTLQSLLLPRQQSSGQTQRNAPWSECSHTCFTSVFCKEACILWWFGFPLWFQAQKTITLKEESLGGKKTSKLYVQTPHYFLFKAVQVSLLFTLTSTEKGGTQAFSALPTMTSSSGSHSLYEQTGESLGAGLVALSSAAQVFREAVAAWVLWEDRCTHPVKALPSLT